MLGPIPPASISIGNCQQNAKFHQFQTKGNTSFGTLLENQEHSFFEGMMGSSGDDHGMNQMGGCSVSSKLDLSMAAAAASNPLKRTLYWTDEDTSTSKRFVHGDHSNDGSMEKTEHGINGNGSIATLLSQLPQTPNSLQQQTMLGSIGDGIFRPPYQLSGLNWYS